MRKGNYMKVIEFKHVHLEEAKNIVMTEYEQERKHIPYLPEKAVPDLTHFADNGLGVAAFEENRMLGFLGAYSPIEDVFGTTNVKGTFSPIHAHGVLPQSGTYPGYTPLYSRTRIYSLLYQAAAVKWVQEGILSHAIALFENDKEGINSFFYNGFGLRCIDAICSLDNLHETIDVNQKPDKENEYFELPEEEWIKLLNYQNALIHHMGCSPTFMRFEAMDETELKQRNSEDVRYFVAKTGGEYAAYIKIANDGENYITQEHQMMNICGAYCNPLYRGTGLYHNLLRYLMIILKKEGYRFLGVDFESINPTALGFWLKYFTVYTQSVVRRIDDKAIYQG